VAQQSQTIAGKTFFQNGEQWIDAEVQNHPDARRVQVEFGSSEYFALVAKNSELGHWASVGSQAQFYFAGVIYDIVIPAP
jgi:hypothetical protein